MQDEGIVALYWQRDEAAIQETEKKYGRYLTKIAWNILADMEDSRESVNDTYLKAWNSMPPNRPSLLSSYLAKITRRVSIDIFRRRNREKRRASEYAISLSELGESLPGSVSPEAEVDVRLLAETIERFLRSLSPDARNTFIGRYYYLDSVKTVAGYCGMSESKAKSLLFRTRNSLREYLREEGFEL